MLRSLASAVSGLNAEQTAMDITGNNIANASTVGFKASRAEFASLLSQILTAGNAPGGANAPGGTNPQAVGLGVVVGSVDQNMGQGTIESTGVPTDVAIQGNGFFVLSNGVGTFYTRAGDFQIDEYGNLVEASTGWKVMGWTNVTTNPGTPPTYSLNTATTLNTTNAPVSLVIPQSLTINGSAQPYTLQSFSIGADGTITGVYAQGSNTQTVVLGQIALAQFQNPSGLVPVGNTAYTVGTNQVPAQGAAGSLVEGALEMSNVNLAQEMTNLVTITAGYQADTKVVQTDQQLIQALIAMKQ
jgi:flagellar hook protein FlgE